MYITRLIALYLILSLPGCKQKDHTIEDVLQKSVEWMWAQQSEDGGWHSETHAVLRDGKVLTPYILYYLLDVPDEIYKIDERKKANAIRFIVDQMRVSIKGDSTTLMDYPNYSAAYALRVLKKLNKDTSLQRVIYNYLINEQFIEHRGFTPEHLAYGGWGFGESNLHLGEHGHVDISHTRRVTEALMEYDSSKVASRTKDAIQWFAKGVQRVTDDARLYEGCKSRQMIPYDGGFIASAVTMSTIKSEPILLDSAGYHYPSYATATCDGFRLMHALNMESTKAYNDAVAWLKNYQQVNTIDGLSAEDPEQWDEIMHYYHLAVRAEAMNIIDPDGLWQTKMEEILVPEQHEEGFYVNPIGGVNKEDDPLMATIFCIQAMSRM